MNLVNSSRRVAAVAGTIALLAFSWPASAQEISDTHLAAARSAISATGVTAEFDAILPQAVGALKGELIQKNPDMQAEINRIVDQTALSLAARRGDLEKEAALAYARVFSEAELKEIATFYQSESGKKLMNDGPIAGREIMQAADIWQRGIGRDLAMQVGQQLAALAPSEPAAPAAEGTKAN